MDIDKDGKDSASPIAEDVRRAVMAKFAKDERSDVLAALERCRPSGEVARVHRAILALSRGSVREVERLVEVANSDLPELLRLAQASPRTAR